MQLLRTMLALCPLATALPADTNVGGPLTLSHIINGLPKDPEGSFALSNSQAISYGAKGEILASRSLTAEEASVIVPLEKRAEDLQSDSAAPDELASSSEGMDWGSCSPAIACTMHSTCKGLCSNCVKIGFFPIRICSQ